MGGNLRASLNSGGLDPHPLPVETPLVQHCVNCMYIDCFDWPLIIVLFNSVYIVIHSSAFLYDFFTFGMQLLLDLVLLRVAVANRHTSHECHCDQSVVQFPASSN